MDKPFRAGITLLRWLSVIVLLKVTSQIVWNYRMYLPPDFRSDFLRGREEYFFGVYALAFYFHIVTSPAALIGGLLQFSPRIRNQFPRFHRGLGRFQLLVVIFGVVPSGLWMSTKAETGFIASLGFASLAIATGTTAVLGWITASRREFDQHRRWMTRCFLLLCSAVFLRLFTGATTILQADPALSYQIASWLTWTVPWMAFEICEIVNQRGKMGVIATQRVSEGTR